ncbi:hypothetical protein C8R46DRAFT_1101964 [Mycena filopes]|nr:hypothetical protein C8R46DRAFT_1101964 [Mycena filopes]
MQTSSDSAPIVLAPSVREAEFEAFISLAYGRPPKADSWPKGSAANPVLLGLLELGRYFMSHPTREFALQVIKTRGYYFPPAQLIYLSYEYNTRTLFTAAFQRLASSTMRALKPRDIEWMGLQVYVALARLQEAVQQQRSILAAEPPQFHRVLGPWHSPECQDNVVCERDWSATWWNGMGRFLLDGRSPLTWTDSTQQFEKMDFGEMNSACLTSMLEVIAGGEGNGYVFQMIAQVSDELMGKIDEVVAEEEVL